MSHSHVIVQADKTIVKVTGLKIKGLNTKELEEILIDKMGSIVRIIGVTGTCLEMDIYDIEEERILKDKDGIIKAISLTEGITASEVSEISYAKKIVEVNADDIPVLPKGTCMKERWISIDK